MLTVTCTLQHGRRKVGLWPYKPMVKKGSCFDWDFSLDASQNETEATSDARV